MEKKKKTSNDLNEIYIHNCCKKLVQLVKVITSMKNNNYDRNETISKLSESYNQLILKLFNDHKDMLENMTDSLYQFRKDFIDEQCKNYGPVYKDLKISYNQIATKQVENINNISQETAEIGHYIVDVNKNTYKECENITKLCELIIEDIKQLKKKPKPITKEEKDKINAQINSNIEQHEQRHQQNIKEMQQAQQNLIRILKMDSQKQIKQHLKRKY